MADLVWSRFGKVRNFVDPFMGSAAMILRRPTPFEGTETVNDADCMVSNFWRALQADPAAVAQHADWPVNEADLHARHLWLVTRKATTDFAQRMRTDPDYFDAKVAGWWVWGQCQWIGAGWCEHPEWQQLPHLGDAGRGEIYDYMAALADRFRNVRVCCGDWSRVMGPTPTVKQGLTAVFLDPPYSDAAGRTGDLYASDCLKVAHDVRAWCLERGDDPRLRIALCGYAGEHDELEQAGWDCVAWKARGGHGSQGKGDNANARKERIWFSRHCVDDRLPLFDRGPA